MNFTPEEIAQTRKEWADATNWDNPVGISEHLDALTVIEQQRAEIARLRAALKRCRIWRDDPERIAVMIDKALKGGEE